MTAGSVRNAALEEKNRADGRVHGPERLYEQDFSASHTSKEGTSMTRRTPLQASAAAGIVLIVLL